MRKRSSWQLFGSRLFIVVCLIILGFALTTLGQAMQRRRGVQREIRVMEEEIARLERQRVKFSDILGQANTPEFLEREARLRLGLQKPGESVLIVPSTGEANKQPSASPIIPASRVKKWRQYFFP